MNVTVQAPPLYTVQPEPGYVVTVTAPNIYTVTALSSNTYVVSVTTPAPQSITVTTVNYELGLAQTILQGPQGIQGIPGLNGDLFYQHSQMVAAATWTVTHNLNKYPSVTVVTSADDVVIGDVLYLNANAVQLSFSAAFAGKAYLN